MTRSRSRLTILSLAALAAFAALAASHARAAVPDRWQQAAAELSMPVLYPTVTFDLRLKTLDVEPNVPCGTDEDWEQLAASYGRPRSTSFQIFEGRPQYCADVGDAPIIQMLRIHGARATLACDLVCDPRRKLYAIWWRVRGVKINIFTSGLPIPKVIRLARGMVEVGS